MANKWNIMLYMAGDNNLSEEMVWAQSALEKVAISDTAISVQFDAQASHIPVYRYVIRKGQKVTRHPVDIGGTEYRRFVLDQKNAAVEPREMLIPENTGSPTTLLNFIWWATRQATQGGTYDADWNDEKLEGWNHMLVLSGHGSGSENDFLRDDASRDSLTIPELSNVLADARKIIFGKGKRQKFDILGMDSCLMSTAEVYHQVHASVKFLVASEGYAPNSGWPYGEMLQKLSKRPADYRADEMAKNIVRDYIDFYKEYALKGGLSVDLSACNVQKYGAFKGVMNNFSEKLIAALQLNNRQIKDSMILAHWRAQTYKSDQYVDLVDFARLLGKSRGIPSDLKEACQSLINLIDVIVLISGYAGPDFQHSNGLSAYFPWSDDSRDYIPLEKGESLLFARETGWHEFLTMYLEATCRPVRPGRKLTIENFMQNARRGRQQTAVMAGSQQSYKWNAPINKWNAPINKGTMAFKSMKNFPKDWRGCEI